MYRIRQMANLCQRDYGHRARIGKIETKSCTGEIVHQGEASDLDRADVRKHLTV